MMDLTFCACGLAMYMLPDSTLCCEACDPNLMPLVNATSRAR